MIEDMECKLSCFGVPVDCPVEVFYDKKLVVVDSSIPTYVLNKRHDTICQHRVR